MSKSPHNLNWIHIGMREHIHVGHFDEDGRLWLGRVTIDVISHGPIDETVGMCQDLRIYKQRIRDALKRVLDHGVIISGHQPKIMRACEKNNMRVIQTLDGNLWWLPIVIYDELSHSIHTPLELRLLRIKMGRQSWQVLDGQPKKAHSPKKRSSWECSLVFGHRIQWLDICGSIHSHTWTQKVQFSRPLTNEEYERITTKIGTKLRASWEGKWVLHKDDKFWKHLPFSKRLSTNPTTEVISIAMIREIEDVLRKENSDVQIDHFELWETPTNFVTTMIK